MSISSALGNLPRELFNKILDHLLNADEVERASTSSRVRGYNFELAILRVNKGFYALAKFHLHNVNTWIRFNINLPQTNPAFFDAPVFVLGQGSSSPPAAVEIHLRFPDVPEEIKAWRVATTDTVCYILHQDLTSFLRYVRLFDYQLCQRVQPGEALLGRQDPAKKGVHGVSYRIEIPAGIPIDRYRRILDEFRDLHGPLHDCKIVGHQDAAHARAIEQSISNEPGGHTTNPDESERTLLLLRMKILGDQHFLQRRYQAAHCVYYVALLLAPQGNTRRYYDARPELHPTTVRAGFYRSLKDALTRTIAFNGLLTLIKCGEPPYVVAADPDLTHLLRFYGHGLIQHTAPPIQYGIYWLAVAIEEILSRYQHIAYNHLSVATFHLRGQSYPQSLRIDRVHQFHTEWKAIRDKPEGLSSIFSSEVSSLMDNASAWMRDVDIPLAYWKVYESQIPDEIRSDVQSILPGSFADRDMLMADQKWISALLQLGEGSGEAYYF